MVEAAAFQVKLTPDNSDYVVYTLPSNQLVYPFLCFLSYYVNHVVYNG